MKLFFKKYCKEKTMQKLEDFYNILNKMIGQKPKKLNFDFHKFLSMILVEEYNKIDILEFREAILNKIFIKNYLIKNSSQIIKIIIENANIDIEPNSMPENINSIKEEDSPLFIKLNNTKNEFLVEIIMDIF